MEEKYQIEVVFEDDLSSEELEITNRYWLIKDGLFQEKPSEIAKNMPFSTLKISKIGQECAHLLISVTCSSCKTRNELKTNSQTQAKRYLNPSWECDTCVKKKEELEKKRLELMEVKLTETRAKKFEQALSEQSWKNFSTEELLLILKMLEAPTIKHLIAGLNKLNDKNNWRILYKADNHGLIDLLREKDNYIIDFYHPEGIKERIQSYLSSLSIQNPPNQSTSPAHPEMGFRLVKNRNVRTPDDALFYNDVTFDRDILIKANTAYAYSVWPRENGDAWISITPSDNILKSKNINRPDGPLHVGDITKKWKY
ncbi:hypothetical protein [Zobellia galactanivorans]|uniref:Uncharacterized protein n=1 Tax=Zobellia galactanivorans (strain DSM 12802 / CCUG 47099 / CIP 106680 / NCIMB 13871 / Dsij) TaxID=63186 RepID=G0L6C9_ZOBGA|nr:hypothetical protein [Zobellia galactanivorans]CAZ96852.1 Hypothetical protein ZOBELLIA_2702 [Zobellia galactanivorans]